MGNIQLYIESYLQKISKKFNIDKNFAFEIFSIAIILEKSFEDVFNNVLVKGSQDGGFDGIYFEEFDLHYKMHVFQCKNSLNLKKNQLDKFRKDFELFTKGDRTALNIDDVLNKLDEYEDLTNKGFIIEEIFYFIFNGDKNENKNKELYETYNKVDFLIIDSEDLFERVSKLLKTEGKRVNDVDFIFKAEKSNLFPESDQSLISFSILNVKSVNFHLNAIELCKLIDEEIKINKFKEGLFSENLRGFLKYNTVNKKIRETLENDDDYIYFTFLNNGITILCDQMKIPTHQQVGQYVISSTNPVIVNGLQTVNVIYELYKKTKDQFEIGTSEKILKRLKNIFVLIRLYETKDTEIIEKITEATNTQTPIGVKDKLSNKDFNKYIKKLFENNNIKYITKKGEIFSPFFASEANITDKEVLKFWYATYYERPEIAKNSISTVLEHIYNALVDRDNPLHKLFNGDKNSPVYKQMYKSYLIYKFVNKTKISAHSDGGDFIKHFDEIVCYGMYKYFQMNNLEIDNDENLKKAYDYSIKIIEKIVNEEQASKESVDETYSHNNYFKNSKSRYDYNKQAKIIEKNDIMKNLLEN